MKKEIYKLISKESSQEIINWEQCLWCGDNFPIFELQKKIENKMGITYIQELCPSCIFRRFMMFRSESSIYKDNCHKCSKDIISMYPPEIKEIVYCKDCYEESDFLIKDDFIPNYKTIKKDFFELWKKIPKKALINENNENSKYANFIGNSKNVYLSYLTYTECENILYSYYTVTSSDCIDCLNIRECQKCYECINTIYSYNCYYNYNLINSSDCYFWLNSKKWVAKIESIW